MGRTVLLPSARGPVSTAVYRGAWFLARRGTPPAIRTRATQFAGPASIAASIVLWLVLLWVGFGLVVLAVLEDVAFSSDVPFGDRGLVEALYLSGVSLTTLGLGDAVGGTDALRLLTVLEAASGLGAFTATISYLPTIFTVTSELRGAALAAGDLQARDTRGAALEAVHGNPSTIEALRRDVVAAREHLLRFPVLFYFHPPGEESIHALTRTAAGVAVALRWAIAEDARPRAAREGAALDASVRRLLDELDRFAEPRELPDGPDAAERVAAVRRHVAGLDADAAVDGPVPEEAVAFLEHVDTTLGRVALMHDYEVPWPLAPSTGPGEEGSGRASS